MVYYKIEKASHCIKGWKLIQRDDENPYPIAIGIVYEEIYAQYIVDLLNEHEGYDPEEQPK